jgi:hypothetical protein
MGADWTAESGSPGDPSDRDDNLAPNCAGLELAHRVGRSVE